jgi:hypothetical protein
MAPKNIHDFKIYWRKCLNIFTFPSLNTVSLQWKETSHTVAVHRYCLGNWIINWDHVMVNGWRVVKWRVIKRGSNVHEPASVLCEFQKHLAWLKLFIQFSISHTLRHRPSGAPLSSDQSVAHTANCTTHNRHRPSGAPLTSDQSVAHAANCTTHNRNRPSGAPLTSDQSVAHAANCTTHNRHKHSRAPLTSDQSVAHAANCTTHNRHTPSREPLTHDHPDEHSSNYCSARRTSR